MIKTDGHGSQNEPICKKIQNYIFKFSDILGKGNFSKVYKAHHEITSIQSFPSRLNSCREDYLAEFT